MSGGIQKTLDRVLEITLKYGTGWLVGCLILFVMSFTLLRLTPSMEGLLELEQIQVIKWLCVGGFASSFILTSFGIVMSIVRITNRNGIVKEES
ncbi:MAG: hypothetical protein ACR2RE_08920, partial [Geminicoccaceae bacterium]